jgi:DMSO/TMAO reductase YedYZ heme-binding membrane subunit
MHHLKKLIFEGHIPYFSMLKKILLIFSFLPVPLYLLTDTRFTQYGEWGWKILIGIMLIRPLADILPGIGLLRSLVPLRKEFGIFCGLSILVHSYAFFAYRDLNILTTVFSAESWSLDNPLTWGLLGLFAVIPLLLTSNQLSIKLLRRQWKNVQRLAYPLFFFAAAHIILINRGRAAEIIIPVTAVFILWLLAHFKVVLYRGAGKQSSEA